MVIIREAVEWGRGKGILSPSSGLRVGPNEVGTRNPARGWHRHRAIAAQPRRAVLRTANGEHAIMKPFRANVDQSRGTATWAAGVELVPWRSQGA
jgi:hypothetical protein